MHGNDEGEFWPAENACEDTFERKGVILYRQANWEYFKSTCKNTHGYGISKEVAIAHVSQKVSS